MPIMQHRLAAVEVGQLAVERDGDRAGQQVDRDDPGVELVAAEVGDDRRQRRCRRSSGRGRRGTARAGPRRGSRASARWLRPRAGSSASARGVPAALGGERFHECQSLPCWWRVACADGRRSWMRRGGVVAIRRRSAAHRRRREGRPSRRATPVELRGRRAGRGSAAKRSSLERVDLVEHAARPARRDPDQDDPAVVRDADALDEPALLHPVDEPGGVRERHVQQVRQPAHRHLAVALERCT